MAASTFIASGTYTTPAGTPATGTVEFTAVNLREVNTATIQDAYTIVANIGAQGALSQTLVVNVGGYNVTEKVAGSQPVSYVIPGTTNINLSTIDAGLAQFDASGIVNVIPPEGVSGTTYSFDLSDCANVVKRFTAATAITATIDGSVVIPVGSVINWRQAGAGLLGFVATNGAVLKSVGNVTHSQGQWAEGTLTKDTAANWILAGEIA